MLTRKKLEGDLRGALKTHDALTVSVLRLLLATIHNREIDKREPLDEYELLSILRKAVRSREEAAELYDRGGSEGRATKERAEAELICCYLPQPLEGEALVAAVSEAIQAVGATGLQEMGGVMQVLMDAYPGRVDGKVASAVVRDALSR